MTNLTEGIPINPEPKPRREKHIADTLQLNVRLREIMSPIWRRILVPANTNLHKLHWFIQGAMGWEDAHLYKFEINGVGYGVPDPEYEGMEVDMHDSKATLLNQVVSGPGHRFSYEYDFGDSWTHDIMVEKVTPGKFSQRYPSCIGGMRACPPEDCGGTPGYEEFLKCIASPRHPRYAEMRRWVGKPFDPEAFDTLEASIAMKRRQHEDGWYTAEPWS